MEPVKNGCQESFKTKVDLQYKRNQAAFKILKTRMELMAQAIQTVYL